MIILEITTKEMNDVLEYFNILLYSNVIM